MRVNFLHKCLPRTSIETFHGNFIYSQSFWQKSSEGKYSKKNFFFSYFRFDVWPGVWTVALYLISQLPTTLSTRLRRFLIGDKMKVEIIKRFRDIGNRLTVIFFLNSCLQRNSTVYDFEDCLTVILTNKIEWNKASGLVV